MNTEEIVAKIDKVSLQNEKINDRLTDIRLENATSKAQTDGQETIIKEIKLSLYGQRGTNGIAGDVTKIKKDIEEIEKDFNDVKEDIKEIKKVKKEIAVLSGVIKYWVPAIGIISGGFYGLLKYLEN